MWQFRAFGVSFVAKTFFLWQKPRMSKRLNGISNSIARDASVVFGTVIASFALCFAAFAEPVSDASFAASQVTVETAKQTTPNAGENVSAALEAAASQIAGLISIDKKAEVSSKTVKIASNGGENDREIRCLAEAIYFESRGEPERGQLAVAEVVRNRVESKAYPNTYCGVVRQRRGNVCQFSWACDSRRGAPKGAQWDKALAMAERVYNGEKPNVVGNAMFFHATFVRPSWSRVFTKVEKIGTHVFYKSN